jgi:thiamine-monophosphate kinase
MSGPDEFEEIARLYRPLTRGAPEALRLLDDAAAIPSRPGWDLVVTKDALVEAVHFPSGEAPGTVAKRLLRANLSDLAAKGAEPYGYFLMAGWPQAYGPAERAAFAAGLDEDGRRYGLILLGGDTVVTPGPLTVSATMLGWVPAGATVLRSGARPGDLVQVSGPIGEGWMAWGSGVGDPHRLPEPRLDRRDVLRAGASAAADVSDGLVADAGHIATASGVGVSLALEKLPLSPSAARWVDAQPDAASALVRLATGGDDYEIVCTAREPLDGFVVIGAVTEGTGVSVTVSGRPVDVAAGGWRHL